MPVEFLSDEQVAAFGRFNGVPSGPELERFFFLDDADLDLIAKRRNSHNQLGFALQLGTVRYLGTFLPDPLEVPWTVVDYLGAQLGIEDPSVVKRYTERLPTQHEHRREIRDLYGFRDFSDPSVAAGLRASRRRRCASRSSTPRAAARGGRPSTRLAFNPVPILLDPGLCLRPVDARRQGPHPPVR